MSSSSTTPVQSAKRPLEDESSPSAPDAKRAAHKKVSMGDETEKAAESTNGVKGEKKDKDGDTKVEDAKEELHAIQSSVPGQSGAQAHQDESAWIHVRAVISSAEAATVIGKGGENVSVIRKMSNAKCQVSEYQKGAVERILTVSGVVDAVAKAFGLIIRTLNGEALEEASTAQSRTYPLRLLIPAVLIGAIIGKGGARIKEIQEQSGAKLNASDMNLPLSSERSLVILGVADAVHIATYYVATTLMDQLTTRFGGPAASAYATRQGGPAGVIPGGMQVVPYVPQSAGGSYGQASNMQQYDPRSRRGPAPYQAPYAAQAAAAPVPQQGAAAPVAYGGPQAAAYAGVGPQQPQMAGGHAGPAAGGHAGPPVQPMQGVVPGQPLTQQIYIPNDMVGAIIGKGGAKINEIRQLSGSVIKINEPQDNSNERLVTITGTAECNQMALYMLYSRLESEKHRI